MTRVSVVTGAAGAMGSECAVGLSSDGAALLLTDRDERGLRVTAERIEQATGTPVTTVVGDIADPEVVTDLTGRVAEMGELRSLVHTAGVSPSMADWQEIMRVDLVGTARLLNGFVGLVVPGSAAVCVASIAGHMGSFDPDMDAVLDEPLVADLAERIRSVSGSDPDPGSAYRLAKRGVIRLCERAAAVWGSRGGRVTSLSPGLMDTAMGRLELANNSIKDAMVKLTPIRSSRQVPDGGLPGHPVDVARAVAFLCSDDASFVSGCDLRVDGGLIAAMQQPERAPGT